MTPEKPGAKRTTESVPRYVSMRLGEVEYRGATLVAETSDLTLSAAIRQLIRAGLRSYEDAKYGSKRYANLLAALEANPELQGDVWIGEQHDGE